MKLSAAVAFASSLFAATLLGSPSARAQGATEEAPFAGKPPASSSSSFAPMAASAASFGGAGQWVISVNSANGGSNSFYLHSGWELNIHPALDYFLISNVSIGGTFGFRYNSGGVTTLDLGARAGYALNISGPVGFWPTAGIYSSFDTGNHMSNTDLSLGIFAPFMWHPVAHFFVGLGPTFNLALNHGNGHEYGLDFIIGGWL